MLAQIVAAGVGVEDIDVVIGDTSAIPYGMGAASSRQTVTAGSWRDRRRKKSATKHFV